MTVTFNVGPSQLTEAVCRDVAEIAASGLLSESHRGDRVHEVVLRAIAGLRRAMRLPDDYTVLFQPSATAAMECVLRNCVRDRSFHFVHGAFSARFAATADQIGRAPLRAESPWTDPIDWGSADVPDDVDLIAVTHTETSAGLMWPDEALHGVRERWPEPILAVDVTSSFGALDMDWTRADVWFGSIQKCLGLPAGLGFLVVGHRVFDRASRLGADRCVAGWQDLTVQARRIEDGDTMETPNVLALALLDRQMGRWELDAVSRATREKAALMHGAGLDARFYIEDPAWRALTVHNFVVADAQAWHERAAGGGFVLGRGYGELRDTCVRIATFPSHSVGDVRRLLDVLKT